MPCFSCERYIYVEISVIWVSGGFQIAAFYTLTGSTCRSCHLFATYLPLFFKPFFSKTPCQKGFVRARLPLCHFLCHFLLCVISWCLGGWELPFWAYIPIYLLFNYKVIKKWQSGKNPHLTRGFTTFAVAKSGKKVANNRQISQKVAKKTQRVKPKPRVEFRS